MNPALADRPPTRSRALARTFGAWLALGLAARIAGFAASAEARPGGGHSFSGASRSAPSSSSSSSSPRSSSWSPRASSSGPSSLFSSSTRPPRATPVAGTAVRSDETRSVQLFAVLGMCILFGGGVLVAGVNALRDLVTARREAGMLPAAAAGGAAIGWSERPRRPRRAPRFKIREHDPNFSEIVLEDLALRIYAAAYTRAAPGGDLDGLAPYLAPAVRSELLAATARHGQVHGVAVGSLRAGKVGLVDGQQTVTVDIEANLSVADATLYMVERWTLARSPEAVTRPPEAVMQLGCPACGAPFRAGDERRCAHCDAVVADGRFEWQVLRREVAERRSMPPTLLRSVVELGTDDPTVLQPRLASRLQELAGPAPEAAAATLAAIDARVVEIFRALNTAWDARDLPRMRPHLSDALFDGMRYWLAAHAARGLHNRVEDASITRTTLARVRRDAYFDAVTLRVHARCLDYTVDHDGRIVSGSDREPRRYSEYWTLIRGRHPGERRGAADQCPGCAAPLRLTMAGSCEHCGRHLTLGEFDWVLSKIEQDEAYHG